MSIAKIGAEGRDKTLTHDEFMRKHERELLESDDDSVGGRAISLRALMKGTGLPSPSEALKLPISALLAQLQRWWLVRLLRAAARENSPDAYLSLLGYWLHKMGVDPPVGVFIPAPGKPGRPRSARTEAVFLTWIDLGKPALSRRKLAHAMYKGEFTKASPAEQKKMIDRCRHQCAAPPCGLAPSGCPLAPARHRAA
jgi:hypothetical protein